MKKTTLIIVVSLLFTFNFSLSNLLAQSPQAFKYQAVVRDNNGNLLINHLVNFKISILKTIASGTAVYVETQSYTTNPYGLANLVIGNGTLVSGNFTTINWGNDEYFVKIEFDANGGSSFQLMGTSQLLSVPYALYSEKAGGDGIWTKHDSIVYLTDTTGNVGIGKSHPGATLDINGDLGIKEGGKFYFLGVNYPDYFMKYLSQGLNFKLGSHNSLYLENSGNVGIGTTTPGTMLDVAGVTRAAELLQVGGSATAHANGRRGIFVDNNSNTSWELIRLQNDNGVIFQVNGDGNVGIGTTNPTYPLCVNGTIQAKEVIVNTGWSDFVFDKDYKLMSFSELKNSLIKTNTFLTFLLHPKLKKTVQNWAK